MKTAIGRIQELRRQGTTNEVEVTTTLRNEGFSIEEAADALTEVGYLGYIPVGARDSLHVAPYSITGWSGVNPLLARELLQLPVVHWPEQS